MSGNVAEWTSSGFNNGYQRYYVYGGGYVDSESNITVTSFTDYRNDNYFGLRLALRCE